MAEQEQDKTTEKAPKRETTGASAGELIGETFFKRGQRFCDMALQLIAGRPIEQVEEATKQSIRDRYQALNNAAKYGAMTAIDRSQASVLKGIIQGDGGA